MTKTLDLEFFPFFVDAFLDATMTWPAQRVGAYVRLLSYQWKRGSVPGEDIEEIARVIGELNIEVATPLWEKLAAKFPKGDHGYQNAKLEVVRIGVIKRMKGNKTRTKAATKAAAESRRQTSRSRDASVTNDVTTPSTAGNLKSGNSKIQTPPQPARRAGLVELSAKNREVIEQILRSLTVDDCATARRFHAALERHFQALGWTVEREIRVPDRGDGRAGYIDLVVHAPERMAFELDRNMPRDKSIEKLITLAESDGYAPVVLCRAAPEAGWWTERRGVEVWGLGVEPVPMYGGRR